MVDLIADTLRTLWPYLFSILVVGAALYTSVRAILFKRDPRAAIAWVGFIWLVPLLGPAFYWVFGVNRIRSKARVLRADSAKAGDTGAESADDPSVAASSDIPEALCTLERLIGVVSPFPLRRGNRIELLTNGDAAYPAMLTAIDGAEQSITLATYIFDRDRVGMQFVDALSRALERGVAVRVLIDGVGGHYSYPPMEKELARRRIPVATFLPTLIPSRLPYLNLRNHRKMMIVDGVCGFTGGLNIRQGHLVQDSAVEDAIVDLHFRLHGPVVADLQRVFARDWLFCTEEELAPLFFPPAPEAMGESIARVIPDGPDNQIHALYFTLKGALSIARQRVRVVTPYFVPDSSLMSDLEAAALRGIEVQIVLPGRSNLSLVQWASSAQLWQVLEKGCEVYLTPPPFDHAKLMAVDDRWTLFGSANWDARSLRLNFEVNVETYDARVAAEVNRQIDDRIARGRQISLQEVDSRSFPVRLRDGIARLAAPYL
jgi:cardiolipin synthase